MKLLYHCPCAEGGLANYGQHQARALAAIGQGEVLWLGPPENAPPAGVTALEPLTPLPPAPPGRSLPQRARGFLESSVRPYRDLDAAIATHRPDAVVLGAWSEYFAPLWAPSLRHWRRQGVRFGAMVHDPVRDYVRGPQWWHRWSIREAYSFVHVAYVHDATAVDFAGMRNPPTVVEIPHGPFAVPMVAIEKRAARRHLGLPEAGRVWLAFGHLRDGKQLDVVLEALARAPASDHLCVAGREQSGGQRPASYYRELAARLGVADRVSWHIGYIPDDQVALFFVASDVLMLTYSPAFRSASGVLNVNGPFGLPVVASGGEGPLKNAVRRYHLGHWLDAATPQSVTAALAGGFPVPNWAAYVADHSWETNAARLWHTLRTA